ncbi:4Fe-4S dicluster domain-containing protein [Emticicia sp. SJ17W-69]|uniref:4Fe-4S dicluster domain-containing protein n=1 Tax=Emticicia sp. SJ17W-69 TaxID=3421657 RepID=UPI003EBE7D9F
MSTYFNNISRGIKTTVKGMSLTLKHFWNARRSRMPMAMQDSSYFDLKTGIVTLQYPHQTLPVPDNGRYQLDCEIDDCIVCDKCAKICPVDCIDIEPIKSAEIISYTSDGSPVRLYAAKFDIDMAKCCFCGLCTTVCPTECLTMTNEYDFSVVDITQMNFGFSNLSPEQADKKRKLYEQFVAEKEELKKSQQSTVQNPQPAIDSVNKPKPAFKPNFKPTIKPVDSSLSVEESTDKSSPSVNTLEGTQSTETLVNKPKPAFKPSFKPVIKTTEDVDIQELAVKNLADSQPPAVDKPKPAFKPSFKPVIKTAENTDTQENASKNLADSQPPAVDKPKPVFKPSFKPVIKTTENTDVQENVSENLADSQPPAVDKPKPVFKPSFKPKLTQPNKEIGVDNGTSETNTI